MTDLEREAFAGSLRLPVVNGQPRIWWLLDVEWGGGILRMAADDLDIEKADGTIIRYNAGLDGEISLSETLPLSGDASGQLSTGIEVLLPVNVPQLVQQGHDLAAARSVLSRWIEGTTWEQRRVVLLGRLVDPVYDDEDAPVRAQLEEVAWTDLGWTHALTQRVDGVTWAHADTLDPVGLGVPYPLIFGTPYYVTIGTGAYAVSGSPGLWIDRRFLNAGADFPDALAEVRILVAGHHCAATAIRLLTDDYPTGEAFIVRNGYDALGQPVCFVPWFDTSTPAGAPDDDWDFPTYSYNGYNSGLGEPTANVAILDAAVQATVYAAWYSLGGLSPLCGDVLGYLLPLTSLPVDAGRLQAVSGALGRYRIDCAITERVSPWDWIRDNLLPILPIAVVSGPRGLYPLLIRYAATAADAVAVLDVDVDTDIEPVDGISINGKDRANRIKLNYAYDYASGEYAASVTLTGDSADILRDVATGDGPANIRTDPRCIAARVAQGRVVDIEISSAVIYEDSTAWAVVADQAALRCEVRRDAVYNVPEGRYPQIERGSVVIIRESRRYVANVALVMDATTRGDGYVGLTLWLRGAA